LPSDLWFFRGIVIYGRGGKKLLEAVLEGINRNAFYSPRMA